MQSARISLSIAVIGLIVIVTSCKKPSNESAKTQNPEPPVESTKSAGQVPPAANNSPPPFVSDLDLLGSKSKRKAFSEASGIELSVLEKWLEVGFYFSWRGLDERGRLSWRLDKKSSDDAIPCFYRTDPRPNIFSSLPEIRKPFALDFSSSSLADASIAGIGKHLSIVAVYMPHIKIGLTSLEGLSPLSNLEILSLEDTALKNISIAPLAKLSKLKHLDLRSTNLDANELSILSDLPNLQYLNLLGNPLSDENVKRLEEYRELRVLKLGTSPQSTDNSFASISKLKKLTALSIGNVRWTDIGLKPLVELPALKDLTFVGYINAPMNLELFCSQFKKMKTLENLTLPGQVTESEEAELLEAKNLKTLNISNLSTDKKFIERLKVGMPTTKITTVASDFFGQ